MSYSTVAIVQEIRTFLNSRNHNLDTTGGSEFTIPHTEFHVAIARGEVETCKQVLNILGQSERAILLNARIHNGTVLAVKPPVKQFLPEDGNSDLQWNSSKELNIPRHFQIELSLVLAAYSNIQELLEILLKYGADVKQVGLHTCRK